MIACQAYKGKGQEYRLFWPRRPEFIRMAARYGATIVPFAGELVLPEPLITWLNHSVSIILLCMRIQQCFTSRAFQDSQFLDLMAESAGVGAEEGFDMLLDSEQIRSIPVLGSMIEERSRKTVPRARRYAARLLILSRTIAHLHLNSHSLTCAQLSDLLSHLVASRSS